MKKLLLIAFVALVLTIGWLLSQSPPSAPLEESSAHARDPKANVARSTSSSVQSVDVLPSPKSAVTLAAEGETQKPIAASVFQDLKDFSQLKQKAFLNEREEAQRKELISNTQLVREMGALLLSVTAMKEPHFEETENAALDLLLEALQAGDRETSAQVIQQVILDAQVEDSKLPQAVRETLAGIKAELLYHAMALAPQTFAQVPSYLPGPVSQKIWQNVQAQHQQNLAESQVEATEHQKKWSRN